MNQEDDFYQRMYDLKTRIEKKVATPSETDEYMQILLQRGTITQEEYQDYKNGKNTNEIIKNALTFGAFILGGYALLQLSKSKN